MTLRELNRLRTRIEKRTKARLWGQEYTITPRLIGHVFGDGSRLLFVQPLATRPNYFVAIVDSSITDPLEPFPTAGSRLDGGYAPALLDEIMDAAEEEYGYFGDDEYRDQSGDESRPFPVTDWGIGCTWGEPMTIGEWFSR